jgi:enoyl-CoA hydratase/carnithine racemase
MALVEVQNDGGIAILTLNNAPANTYSLEMMKALDEAVLGARFDDSVHVILIRGAGDKFFCAGADIAMLGDVTPNFKYNFCLHANETLLRLEQTPKLVIAALNGHTVGGGLEVAMAADIRIGRENGGKIGLPEVHLGVLPGTGGTQRLARMVGKAKAIELMALGTNMSMDEGHALGLVNHVFSTENWWEQVLDYTRQFVPPNKASFAVGRIKRSVQAGAEMTLEAGLALERELQQQLFLSEDAAEGINAYNEKRKAEFKGQ